MNSSLAEERADHPLDPSQLLEDNPCGPICTRAKTPSAMEAGPIVPAAQSALLGVEPQAILRVWVDAGPAVSGRPVDDPTHQITIPSSFVPELVTFIANINNQTEPKVPGSPSKLSLDQLTTNQKIAEAILPKQQQPARNRMANRLPNRLPNRTKGAFRRNPLLATPTRFKSEPVQVSLDPSAADGIPTLEAHTHSNLEDTLAPVTPRGSNWSIGSLLQPHRAIKRLFGFSPLAQASESLESSPQMPITSTAQALTEKTAPTEPKKKALSPTSARDTRARNRRHHDSVIKPAKPTTASRIQRDRLSRVGEASPASSRTEPISAEGEFPTIRPRQGQIEEPTAGRAIRWPSRTLDRMNQNRRRHWGDPVTMPSLEGGSYGLGETDFDRNLITRGQPGRIRTGESHEFTIQTAGDPNTARPYSVPNLQNSAAVYQGGNVFAEYEAAQKAANTGKTVLTKTPIPITNFAGSFKVPSPSDSDWSDSENEEEEGEIAGLEDITPSHNNNWDFALTKPTFLPWKLPNPQKVPLATQSEALRKAQEKLLKHKPSIPSRLSQSSQAYSSLPVPDKADQRQSGPSPTTLGEVSERQSRHEAAITSKNAERASNAFMTGLEDLGANRPNQYNGFREWSETASLAVTSALEKMEVDSKLAGQAFKSGFENFTTSK